MASLLPRVIKEYKIGKKVGFFVADNASSNDTCIDILLRHRYPLMTPAQRARRRLRCLGHIVNLAAQVLILGDTAERDLNQFGFLDLISDYTSVAGA